jgi:cyanophycin synthetase
MSMLFKSRCLQKALSHRILSHLKAPPNSILHPYKYENCNISKYIETAEKMNIEVIHIGFGIYELKKGNIHRRIMKSLTDKEGALTYKLCGNKYVTYKILLENDIKNIPKHQLYSFSDINKTCKDFINWNCPVVIKPCSGTSGGMGVTVNIKTIKELKNAIAESFIFDRKYYLMEHYIEGSHFRILTLKGDYISCCQRIPARIIGNGKDSIAKLIEKENYKRGADRSRSGEGLYPIVVDNEVRRKIKSINKTMDTMLENNEEIYVKDIVNLHSGGEVRNVENVSEDIKSICKKISQILDIYLAGFDIITSDISKPFSETNGVINEVNTAPGIEGMYKSTNSETFVDVAEIILKDMFNM